MAAGARLYEPLLGRLLSGLRRAAWELCPPRPGLVVLDVGCGTGAFLAPYAAADGRVMGLDASAEMLGEARRRLGTGALLVRGEAGSLPAASGSADLVVALMLFHALAAGERGPALAEMARVAGASGRVLVADHRPARFPGIGPRLARGAAGVIEAVAGHGAGVRSLVAAGGVGALAGAVGLEAEASRTAAAGALEVVLLRRAGAVA